MRDELYQMYLKCKQFVAWYENVFPIRNEKPIFTTTAAEREAGPVPIKVIVTPKRGKPKEAWIDEAKFDEFKAQAQSRRGVDIVTEQETGKGAGRGRTLRFRYCKNVERAS